MKIVKPLVMLSEAPHVFLTGALQVGKSTALRRALAMLPGQAGGFQTYFTTPREQPDRVLYMADICMAQTADDAQAIVRFGPGRPLVDVDKFDRLGVACLAKARQNADIIVMDECGRLERDALGFQQAVLDALDGATPVLGVVRHDAGGWTEAIRSHPQVQVIEVTEMNRDALPSLLARHFGGGTAHG